MQQGKIIPGRSLPFQSWKFVQLELKVQFELLFIFCCVNHSIQLAQDQLNAFCCWSPGTVFIWGWLSPHVWLYCYWFLIDSSAIGMQRTACQYSTVKGSKVSLHYSPIYIKWKIGTNYSLTFKQQTGFIQVFITSFSIWPIPKTQIQSSDGHKFSLHANKKKQKQSN